MVAAVRDEVVISTEARGAVARLWDTAHGEVVVAGPAGTGKTRGILDWIHYRCSNESLRVLFLRKTHESLKTSALVTYQEQVLHAFDGKRSVMDGVRYFGGNDILPPAFTYEATGAKIVVAGMDQPSKVKSTEWDIIFINEVTELSLDEYETVTGRADRPSMTEQPPNIVVGDCNPDAPSHWIKQRETAGSVVLWHSRHEDNPAMWDARAKAWTVAGLRYMARLDKLTGVRYQRLRLGNWVAAEGQVYDGWSDAIHVVPNRELPAQWDRALAIDFGYTNPFVLQCWAIDPDGRLILEHEIYRTRRLVTEHAADWQAFWGTRRAPVGVVTDHDAEDRATWEQATGMATTPARKDVSPGIQAMANRLKIQGDGKPRLMVFRDTLIHPPDADLRASGRPTCTRDEVLSYVWDTRRNLRKGEQPVKEHDHGMDAARYMTMALDGPDEAADDVVVYDRPVRVSPY